jgi:uncharacterized protein
LHRTRFYDARPFTGRGMAIPAQIVVSKAVEREASYRGEALFEQLPGLRGASLRWEAPLKLGLRFQREDGAAWLAVDVSGEVLRRCERCGEERPERLEVRKWLRLVRSEAEEAEVLAEADPVRVDDDQLAVFAVVEQELLLDEPVVARCAECRQALHDQPREGMTVGPLAALKSMIKQ